MKFRIAHLSDIHFFHFEKSLVQFFSKRCIGNFNYYLTRRKIFDQTLAYQVVETLLKEGVTHLIITGDYTSTSSKQEFKMMQDYIKFLLSKGFIIYTFPGNHDVYTRKVDRNKLFYSTLEGLIDFQGDTAFNLIDHRVAAYKLGDTYLLCCDASHASSPIRSTGFFDPETEANLRSVLNVLPPSAPIIFASHYPYEKFRYPNAHLKRGEVLESILSENPNIQVVLHGHRHEHRIERAPSGHLLLDSGSISLAMESTFNLIELESGMLEIMKYAYQNNEWKKDGKETRHLVSRGAPL